MPFPRVARLLFIMAYKLPFSKTELAEIKLSAHHRKDDLVLALFEHIEHPEELDGIREERDDYRDQVASLESRLRHLTNPAPAN